MHKFLKALSLIILRMVAALWSGFFSVGGALESGGGGVPTVRGLQGGL